MLISLVVCISGLNADASIDEDSINLTAVYNPGEKLKGTFELGLAEVQFNSKIEALFDGESARTRNNKITIKEFLDNVGAEYDCTTSDCNFTYSAVSGTGEKTKTFSLAKGESKIIGAKIEEEGEVLSAFNFKLSLSSSTLESCATPVTLDILDDGAADWVPDATTGDFSCFSGSGCFAAGSGTGLAKITSTPYCEKINIPPAPAVRIGANLEGEGSTDFVMSLRDADGDLEEQICTFSASGSGKYSCMLEDVSVRQAEDYYACISLDESEDGSDYSLRKETREPCGFAGFDDSVFTTDFDIFAETAKYSPAVSTNIKSEEIDAIISDYIATIYDGKCASQTGGCIIPIRISSGQSQEIFISNFSISYEADTGLTSTTNDMHNVIAGESLISLEQSEIDIEDSGFTAPKTYGTHELMLRLAGKDLFDEPIEIEVLNAPLIDTIYPQKAPVGIDVLFWAYTLGANATRYTWDFGDNTSIEETSANRIAHKFSSLGTYTLLLTAGNTLGNATKRADIKVLESRQYIELVFNESFAGIAAAKKQIANFSGWVSSYLSEKINLDSLEIELNKLRVEYNNSGGSTSAYIGILSGLDALEIPKSIAMQEKSSQDILIDSSMIDLNVLETAGAGKKDSASSQESYKDAIAGWTAWNLNIRIEEDAYNVYSNGIPKTAATAYAIILSPRSSGSLPGKIYLVIKKPLESLGFADSSVQASAKSAGDSTVIELSSISGTREIELIMEGGASAEEFPIYLSPQLSELSLDYEIDICNNNNRCEENRGENWKNCGNDCKPWGWVLLWLFALLFISLCVYIALQEWYKRRYEDYLFKDKNDLFNLINFMDNAEKQKRAKEEMFDKLKEKRWIGEQIVYAWKKYKGERTGMWEIPIFKFLENAKVRKELEARRKSGESGRLAPIPHIKPGAQVNRNIKKFLCFTTY